MLLVTVESLLMQLHCRRAAQPVSTARHHAAVTRQQRAQVTWRRAKHPLAWRSVGAGDELTEDGAVIWAFRTDVPDERCPACGRRRLQWRVDLQLPSPFPAVGTAGRGCTRDHALHDVPASWTDVARYFTALANAVRSRDPLTAWDARHADMRAGQAARAARVAGWNGEARRLALRLWTEDPRLDVQSTDVVVTAVLSAPA